MNIRVKRNLFESVLVEFKNLYLFYFAILSLLLGGSLANNDLETTKFYTLGLASLIGVFLIYGMHMPMNQPKIFTQIVQFFNVQNKKFFILVLLLSIPIFFHTLQMFSLFLFGLIGFIGVLYSISFTINDKSFRLKDFLVVKNSLIGISWGVLVLAGAGEYDNENVWAVTLLVIIQVFIGSMIRDLPDIKRDIKDGVRSFPVVIGRKKSIQLMHFLNVSSLLIFSVVSHTVNLIVLVACVILYRAYNLFKISRHNNSRLWLQTLNLFTCTLIFIILLVQNVFANI